MNLRIHVSDPVNTSPGSREPVVAQNHNLTVILILCYTHEGRWHMDRETYIYGHEA